MLAPAPDDLIRVLDVCSGYSASTLAWDGLGFKHVGYAEIEPFPSAILGARYGAGRPRYMPDPEAEGLSAKDRKAREAMRKAMASLSDSHFGNMVPNFGDFTQIREDDCGPVDLLTGGTPCQTFSVAGKRLGLDDPRGNLTLEFLALARRKCVPWLAWENVPGFLSHDAGRTMGTFLGLLGDLGYGFAWRVLDAQYIRVDRFARAVPQRRKRLIVVGCFGNPSGAAAVLFERESLRGDLAPRREAPEDIASPLASGSVRGGGYRNDADTAGNLIKCGGPAVSPALKARDYKGPSSDGDGDGAPLIVATVAGTLPAGGNATGGNATGGDRYPGTDVQTADTMLIASTMRATHNPADWRDNLVSHALRAEGFDASEDGTGRGTPIVPVCIHADAIGRTGEALNPSIDAVAFNVTGNDGAYASGDVAPALKTGTDASALSLVTGWRVRRLMPVECERLMGIPDDFTNITFRGKPAADGPRYKVCGNSQAGNMMRWLGHGLATSIRALR